MFELNKLYKLKNGTTLYVIKPILIDEEFIIYYYYSLFGDYLGIERHKLDINHYVPTEFRVAASLDQLKHRHVGNIYKTFGKLIDIEEIKHGFSVKFELNNKGKTKLWSDYATTLERLNLLCDNLVLAPTPEPIVLPACECGASITYGKEEAFNQKLHTDICPLHKLQKEIS